MHWFLIALLGPLFYAFANHTDKYLLDKYLKKGEAGAFIIFSALFTILALPVIALMHHDVFSLHWVEAVGQTVGGALIVLSVLFYFYALEKDEASFVVPLYQTMPIFAFFIGFLMLGETVTMRQLVGSVGLLLGAVVLSVEIHHEVRFKRDVLRLMLIASFLYALSAVLFKYFAGDTENFWPSLFWMMVGKVVMGILFFAFVPKFRDEFLTMVRGNKLGVIGVVSLSETFFILAEATSSYAVLLAPVALVLLVDAFQPVFVLVIGIVLTLFFPRIGRESLTKWHLVQKLAGIGCIVAGSLFIG